MKEDAKELNKNLMPSGPLMLQLKLDAHIHDAQFDLNNIT